MADYRTIISPEELQPRMDDPDWAVFDCRFSLEDPQKGRRLYRDSHIPGAIYVHLNQDLSGEILPGKTGRHPLPDVEDFVGRLSSWGVDDRVQVVGYDDRGGAIAARLWWMLRWLGHDRAAVLDGGWSAWLQGGYPVTDQVVDRDPRDFKPQPRPGLAVDVKFVDRIRDDPAYRLLDARDAERYRGEDEPIDPIAGHIPGALSAPYVENLNEEGKFRPPDELKRRYRALLGDRPADRAVVYCGSGVTSVHDIIAMVHVGFNMPRLYPGSWSEWITDPSRPIE